MIKKRGIAYCSVVGPSTKPPKHLCNVLKVFGVLAKESQALSLKKAWRSYVGMTSVDGSYLSPEGG